MKKMLRMRNSIIVILCFTIICMAIGFSLLSIKLEKIKKEKPNFNIMFEKVIVNDNTKSNSKCSNSIINSSKEVYMNCLLDEGYQLSYSVVIKNVGNMDAQIISVVENVLSSNSSTFPVKIKHSDLGGEVLKPNEEATLDVSFNYPKGSLGVPQNFNYSLFLVASSPSNS